MLVNKASPLSTLRPVGPASCRPAEFAAAAALPSPPPPAGINPAPQLLSCPPVPPVRIWSPHVHYPRSRRSRAASIHRPASEPGSGQRRLRQADRHPGRSRRRACGAGLCRRPVQEWPGPVAADGAGKPRRRQPGQRAGGLRDRAAQGAGRRAGAEQREEHHRRGFRQGWRRQVDHRRQPGAGPGPRGRAGRHAGRGYLRPQPGHHVRHSRGHPSEGARREVLRAHRGPWRAGDVHGLPHR